MMRVYPWIALIRADKPIGFWLLVWPVMWSLWIAAEGMPHFPILAMMVAGCWIMRSAGCVINDWADRNIDPFVKRSCQRPIARGDISPRQALIFFLILMMLAFLLVKQLNTLTQHLAWIAAVLAMIYPFSKRYFGYPQVFLGLAFAWGVPMAFTAASGHFPIMALPIFILAFLWPLAYDTIYAMMDKHDDLKLGLGSMAISLDNQASKWVARIYAFMYAMLIGIGLSLSLPYLYFLGLTCSLGLNIYLWKLAFDQEKYAQSFHGHHWMGMLIWLSFVLGFWQKHLG